MEKLLKKHSQVPTTDDTTNPVIDPSTIDRDRFVGLWIVKEFEGHGDYKGQVISHDVDMLKKPIFRIRCLDGDEEDLFLEELVLCVGPDKLFLLINE